MEKIQTSLQKSIGTRFCWLADEWFLIAGLKLPSYKTYENMPQESNGVGSIRSFLKILETKTKSLPEKIDKQRKVSWKTNIHVLDDTNDIISNLIGLSKTKEIHNYA